MGINYSDYISVENELKYPKFIHREYEIIRYKSDGNHELFRNVNQI